jgi:signal transduction histidine kinase
MPADDATARLLEQLMRIARVSALEEMASGFAHELNQPIGAIATFAQAGERMLARMPPAPEGVQEVLRHISNEAMSAGAGIHRIRRLFNDRDIARQTCSIAEVVGELLPVLRLLAGRAGVSFPVQVQPDLPPVSIDRLRIQHVLFTLVQNALEAPRRPGMAAEVHLEVRADKYEIRVNVIDHGPGIAPEHREQLFRPFFTTKIDGTGLGLASSRAILEAHQGSIGFDSDASGDTRFWFSLPVTATSPKT